MLDSIKECSFLFSVEFVFRLSLNICPNIKNYLEIDILKLILIMCLKFVVFATVAGLLNVFMLYCEKSFFNRNLLLLNDISIRSTRINIPTMP